MLQLFQGIFCVKITPFRVRKMAQNINCNFYVFILTQIMVFFRPREINGIYLSSTRICAYFLDRLLVVNGIIHEILKLDFLLKMMECVHLLGHACVL